jgi:predicted aminopeptidase
MQYVRIICKIAEVAFNLFKVLGGNWAAVFALFLSMADLHEACWPEARMAQAA